MSRHYLIFIIVLGCVTLFSHLFRSYLELINIALLHLIPVLVVALRAKIIATCLASLVVVILFNILYVPPLFSFTVYDFFHIWTFLIFFIVGGLVTFQAKKIQSSKIKEILLNALSHDLKTPLSSILGNTTLLLEQSKLPADAQQEILEEIRASGEQMNRLVASLLDNARLQEGESALRMDWCDLEDSLGVALQEFRHKEEELKLSVPHDLPLYWGDQGLLVRLFVNLLDNAFKYSTPNQAIHIKISHTPSAFYIRFFNRSSPIAIDEIENIFDIFQRLETDADIKGNGIGLFICKKIAQAHKGKIEAFPQKEGISFYITLPILKHPPHLFKETV
ncbi:DUF4118 domain-containing protein [Sulfurospirillum sp. T05]|uniref:histidine kinase n=1 Tax=Sulfurospirillum tamanense TaxID=2813362 RepID=A0ABS2WQD0_9BACT|nr:ATP-binding protein [Sulfurospirillum tamanensis]MBN2963720.1 DUF4118 domain-containing protein [Sulfurospirillum tamanensis]